MSNQKKQKPIIEQIKEHWLYCIIGIIVLTAGITWSVSNALSNVVIEQQKIIIEYQKLKISGLKDEIELDNYRSCLPNLTIKITSPKNGDKVPVSSLVRGTLSGELQKGKYVWVIVNPYNAPGLWWPQIKRVESMNGLWNIQAWFVDTSVSFFPIFQVDKKFDIAVVLLNQTDDQYYSDYMKKGKNTREFPGMPLPDSAIIMDIITVMNE